jgi:hypothetical protein
MANENTKKPALVIMNTRRVFATVRKPGHPHNGKLVEVTGRGRGAAVYCTPLFAGPEEEFSASEIQEVCRGA